MDKVWTIESDYETAEKYARQLTKKSGFKNQKILVKPNLLCPTPPEDVATTHPTIVAGVVKQLIDNNCEILFVVLSELTPCLSKNILRYLRL